MTRLSLLLLLVLLIYKPFALQADALDEVLGSPELRRQTGNTATNNKQFDAKWFKSRDNLAALFKPEGKGALLLLEWIGEIVSSEFALQNKIASRKDEYVALDLDYVNPKKAHTKVTILVAHPRYRSMVEMHLVKRFTELEPPSLPIEALEKLEVRNNIGMLYHRRDGTCSLLFKLPNQNMVNLATKNCDDSRDLIRLAELLNLERLKQKLED